MKQLLSTVYILVAFSMLGAVLAKERPCGGNYSTATAVVVALAWPALLAIGVVVMLQDEDDVPEPELVCPEPPHD